MINDLCTKFIVLYFLFIEMTNENKKNIIRVVYILSLSCL